MSLIILGIILSIINYVHCVEFNFTSYPEKIVPGEIMDIQFDIIGNSNNTEYTIDFSLCQSVEFSSCIPLDQMITNDDNNSKGLFAGANNDTCFFNGKPKDDWQIKAEIKIDEEHTFNVKTPNITRELICNNPNCVEVGCPNFMASNNAVPESNNRGLEPLPISEPIIDNNNNNNINHNGIVDNKKNDDFTHKKYIYIAVISSSLLLLAIVLFSVLYVKKFKKRDDDPIPIFSVEESSYCYDGNTHSPNLAGASYNSAVLEKSFLSTRSGNGQPKYCHSPKAADQSHLSVQLCPINDGYSHSSQNSNRSKSTVANSIKSSQEKQKNETNDINRKMSSPESPNFTSLSPMSMASTIPFIPNQKPSKKKSTKGDKKRTMPPSPPHVYAETPIVIDKKVSNSHLFADTSMVSDNKSKISEKRSFQSSRTGTEVEARVLSSKHYVLSNFDGDDAKEELKLHYGDIVSVINILQDGWAYGELLLKYNHYENNGNNQKSKTKEPKYRKFGYYPIKCLSPEEEDADEISPKKENLPELKSLASSDDNNTNNTSSNQNEKAPVPKTLNVNENSTCNMLFVHPRSTGHKTVNSRSSKRSSILNMLKRNSVDYGKEALVCYNEPQNEKYNSRKMSFSDTESSAGTVYHDAEETEQKRNSFDPKRISVRSSFSYRSYM
jgi:hypothetical protein